MGENRGGKKILYFYDQTGINGFSYDGKTYSFAKDIQGNVTGIFEGMQPLARYVYDAWGNHKVLNPDGTENTSSTFIGNINSIRYRGYYWDSESNLYYLNSRYYDPEIGGFISPDNIANLVILSCYIQNGLNSYVYCLNDPINFVDYGGYLPQRQGDWIIIDKRLKFRLNDKDHIHVKYKNQEYAWLEKSKKTKDPKTNLGLNDLPESAQRKLKNAGVPNSFFNKMSYVDLPRWQEGFSINDLPRWQEGFSIPQTGQSNIVIYVSIGVGIFVLCCVVAAFFTGGQSLWGLLALA